MKILQIANYMYPDLGGIGQVARDIANVLSLHPDIRQRILCFNSDAQDGVITTHHNENVVDVVDGIEVIRCSSLTKISSQSISLEYIKALDSVINHFDPDIVIFHYPNPFQAQFLLRYRHKSFKLIVYWHSDIIKQKFLEKLFISQNHALLKWAWKVVSTSPNYVEGSKYLSQYKDKCIVIPNCVRTDNLVITEEIAKLAAGLRKEGKIMCFALGRHVPYKGMEYLIRASRLLDDRFQICIGGSGPLTKQLKQMAEGDSKVQFLGRISHDLLVAYYETCDIFCFPSITKNEAFGIALAEGMYFDKPAVTFTIPGSGVNYVNINDVTGIECPNRDVQTYAQAILKLGNDVELRHKLGTQARERMEEFVFDKFKEKIIQLIDEVW